MTDPRLARWQMRKNGELLLRWSPPSAEAPLRAVESRTWSEGWGAFYRDHPELRPQREHEETFPRERLAERLEHLLAPETEYLLVVSVRDVADAIRPGVATVAGPGQAMIGYLVELIEAGREDMFILDEAAGMIMYVDQDDEFPGEVLVVLYRWPDVEQDAT